nr:hypothetical protein [Tanacetum cinerariifolium]
MEARKESLTDLASKIRNIEGRVKGGQLRQAIRNVNKTTPGTYVMSVFVDNSTKAPSLSMEDGTNNKAVKPPVENVTNNMATKNQSFASMFKNPIMSKAARLSVMKSVEVPGANVAIPLAEVELISKSFENILYGYFIGKRLAFQLVENYVKNAWAKFGLECTMLMNGKPIMLDSYTSTICQKSWGKNSYARVLTEVSSLTPLLESMVVAVPFLDGSGHSFETVKVEYEWQSPRCDTCKIFDHIDNDCPKRVKEVVAPDSTNDDGFTKVTRKQGKGKHSSKSRQTTGESSSSHTSHVDTVQVDACTKSNDLNLSNSFSSLDYDDEEFWTHSYDLNNATLNVINESDSEDVDEELVVECDNRHVTLGASTPINERVFRHWNWASNSSSCLKGTRIILGWNYDVVDTSIISHNDQVMHTRIWIKAESKEFFCSFIYAHNRYTHRRGLWNCLNLHKNFIHDRPWCILGDFNAALNIEDTIVGSSIMDISMCEFRECIDDIELMDVPQAGLKFTWNQKPQGNNGILKKLDRVMANVAFSNGFAGNYAVFQPYGISDHSPAVKPT